MKRTLSFLLALVMVLGTFTTVFAAEPTVEEAAGALLKEFGVLQGNQDGELNLGQDLKRRDAVVLLSRLMDAEEEAKVFPADDLVFDDITDAFYKGYVAWAVSNGLAKGKSATKFDPNGALTAQHFATFLLRALGHEVEGEAYDKALETAKELGLLADVEVVNSTVVKRGVMAVMTVNALGTPMNGSEETLAAKLGLEMPVEEPTLSTDIEITSAAAIANNKVEVKVKEEVAASKADFTIVKKGTTTAVEVKDVVKESAKVFVIETEALVGGTAYTVTANGVSINFTGISADKSAPKVVKVSAVDTNTFDVEYSDKMDFATVTNVANYKVDKDLKVVKVELNSARKVATVTTDSAKRGMLYTITIEGVLNSDGVAMTKSSHKVTAIEDRTPPRVANIKVQNNRMIIVTFDDANGMDKASVEDLANYSINDLNITSVKAYNKSVAGDNSTVVLTTDTQVANKAYTLTIEGVKDGSTLANALVKTTRSLRGAHEDKTAPTVKADSIKPWNNNEVRIEFNEYNAMDAASLEDIGNYVITYGNNEVLPIYEAKAWDTTYPKGYATRGVTLYTAPQDEKVSYRIEVKGVKDEFGNELKPVSGSTYAKYYFKGSNFDNQAPFVTKVEYVNSTTVKLNFSEVLKRSTAIDPTNYVINGKIDTVIKASLSADGLVVTLTTQSLANNGTYTITMNNIEDEYGNATINAKAKFIATASGLDLTAPSLVHAYAVNNQEIHLTFNEEVNYTTAAATIKLGAKTFSKSGLINDGTTVVYNLTKAAKVTADGTYSLDTTIALPTFEDLAGNKLILDACDIYIANVDNVAAEIEYVEQINTKKIKVVFTEPVNGSMTVTGSGAGFRLGKVDIYTPDTFVTEWYITSTSNFVVGKEITIGTTGMNDLAGEQVKATEVNKFTPWYEDLTAPTIVDVRATDRNTIVISYDEDIEAPGRYRVYYNDNNGKRIPVAVGDTGSVYKNEVTIKVTGNALASHYVYELEVMTGARDIAGNREEVISGNKYDFYGSDVTTGNFITGVKILNAKSVEVTATKEITGIVVYEVYKGTNTKRLEVSQGSITPVDGDVKVQSIGLKLPVLAGYDYIAEVSLLGESDPQTYKFAGVTEDRYITLTEDSGIVKLGFDGYTNETETQYEYAIFRADGTQVSLTEPAGVWASKLPVASSKVVSALAGVTEGEFYVLLYRVADGVLVNAAKVEVK